ncbi:response regulator [Marinicella litoralis]|uniref:Two-component system response regulator BaeR n=1 Tax=Marinicella litoralis TaxID=644220 RepID=A0A4R6XZH6_9GAMM|nr:response regulator [Marinicella litoralis]TDR23707.1 two-component system response regulator BaeR [Marinicella litoralis]
MSNHHILIVEDEENLAELMRDYLHQESYQVSVLFSGEGVESFIQQNKVDVVLLDLMLPEKNGIEICRDVRKFSDVPIIMTTARVEEIDRILGLEIGANDYVCKPYSPRELVARVKVQLRSQALRVSSNQLLELDANQLLVKTGSSQAELTAVEFKLLEKLHSQPGRVFNRDQLMDAVYSDGRIVSDRTIDSHIKKTRQKLKKMDQHDFVQAVYGCGYKFVPKP